MLLKFRTRQWDAFAGVFCFALIGFAIYLQEVKGLEPCLLCTLQRIVFVVMGIFFLLGALMRGTTPKAIKAYHWCIASIGVVGVLLAGRHVWIQHMPHAGTTACLPDMIDLFKLMPMHEALAVIFKGGSECSKVVWRFMGFSLASWTLFCFLCLTGLSVHLTARRS